MAKLTKPQAKAHAQACKLLEKDNLTYDEKFFILENWQESANHVNSTAGAFFTPPMLARDFALEVGGGSVIDLCAGIGALSFFAYHKYDWEPENRPRFTCVELNPDYIAVGKKILPEATWIQADVFNLPKHIGNFCCAISNPPFGATPRSGGKAPRQTQNTFEYSVIDIASDLADYGAFIIPQGSAPFEYSGKRYMMFRDGKDLPESEKCQRFHDQTQVDLTCGIGIDTSIYRNDWKGVSPAVEVVTADFTEARQARMPKSVEVAPVIEIPSPTFVERIQSEGRRQMELF